MMPVTVVTDAATVKRIADMPNNRRWATSDESPDDYVPIFGPGLTYLAPMVGNEPAGVIRFDQVEDRVMDVHMVWDPAFYGCAAEGLNSAAWAMLLFSEADTVLASIPVDNRLAVRTARAAGFERIGRSVGSFQRGGKMIDQDVMKFTGEETCHF